MKNLVNVKVLLGNVGVEYTDNGKFVQRETIMVNPNESVENQVIESIRNNKMNQYDWTIIGNVFEYWAEFESTNEGIRNLKDKNYSCVVA